MPFCTEKWEPEATSIITTMATLELFLETLQLLPNMLIFTHCPTLLNLALLTMFESLFVSGAPPCKVKFKLQFNQNSQAT